MQHCSLACLFGAVLVAASPAQAVEYEVRPLTGDPVAGTLKSLTATQLTLLTPAGEELSFETKQLLAIKPRADVSPPEEKTRLWFELGDGSRILAEDFRVQDSQATVNLVGGGEGKVPTANIVSIRFREQDEAVAGQWNDILAGEHNGDVLVIRKGGALNFFDGVIGEITAEVVNFTSAGEKIPVRRENVEGLIYFHPGGFDLPEPACVVTDAAGSTLQARQLELKRDESKPEAPGELDITTAAGLSVRRGLDRLRGIDFSRGNLVFLSDLEPTSREFTPFVQPPIPLPELEEYYRPRRDETLGGGKLTLGIDDKRAFDKGLWIHSRTELTYRLPGAFSKFRAVAGIDASQEGRGHVRLVISGDGRTLYEAAIAGTDEPRELELDVSGVRRLTILVDFGEDLDSSDHLVLGNARIVK